jgi:hypothetical protein
MTIWDEFFNNNSYNRHFINRSSDNWYLALWREMNNLMNEALDEAVPVEKPQTKVVSTKIVERNGKKYKITVEQILDGDETDSVEIAEDDEDFDSDFTEDNA